MRTSAFQVGFNARTADTDAEFCLFKRDSTGGDKEIVQSASHPGTWPSVHKLIYTGWDYQVAYFQSSFFPIRRTFLVPRPNAFRDFRLSRVSHPLILSYRIKIHINGVRFKLIFPLCSSTVLFLSLILSYGIKSLPQRIDGVLRRFNFILCLPKISYFLCTLYRSAVSGWSWDKNFQKVNFNPRFNEYYGV